MWWITIKITILCSSQNHPIFSHLEKWVKEKSNDHQIELLTELEQVNVGNILFMISYDKIVKSETRNRFEKSLVIHASDLPVDKGWSPHIWKILSGENKITLTLFEAVDKVDAGDIWKKQILQLDGHELFDEINEKLFKIELELMDFAINNLHTIHPIPQPFSDGPTCPKRTPEDSELDPHKSIVEQFDLLRVSDPNRFPCYFYLRGKKFLLLIKKI